MPSLKEEYTKEEKIDGVIYDMSPSPNYQHGIANSNIHTIIKHGLKGTLCLTFMENLDYKYHAQENDDYVIPDVMIICDRKHLKGGSYTGTPRFIVETLSPATALRDKTVKKELYQNAGKHCYSASPAFCESIANLKITSASVTVLDQDMHEIVRHKRLYGSDHESMDWYRILPI